MGDSVAKPIVPFFRLGLVLILALIAAAFLAWLQQPATTKVQTISQSLPAVSKAKIISNVPRANENVPPVDGALIEASAMMIPAPPDTDRALQRVDPRRLRSSFQRGTAAMQKYIDDDQ